jgi:transposase
MGAKLTLVLSIEDRAALDRLSFYERNWRQRERARTLTLLDDGYSTREVAAAVGVDPKTVGTTRTEWLNFGISALADKARSGAPRKLTNAQVEKIVEFARAEPLSAKDLLVKHVENGGVKVHLNTLIAELKAAGLVWKRTRHSLKKSDAKLPSELPKSRSKT